MQLYKEVIKTVFNAKTSLQRKEEVESKNQLKEVEQRLSEARDLLLSGAIEGDDYRIIKSECEDKIRRLEAKLTTMVKENIDVEVLLDQATSSISKSDVLYTNGSVIQKRKLISSIFPEKLTFDGLQYRITRTNEAIQIFNVISNELSNKKNETNQYTFDLSREVTPQRLELWTH